MAPLRLPRRTARGRRRFRHAGDSLTRPPALGHSGLLLRRDATFIHEGQCVTHPGLYRAFLKGVRFLVDEGVFVVQVAHFRAQIDVEDVPFWVVAYDPGSGEIELSDQTREPLVSATLTLDPDQVLRCRVKSRFPARFTRAGQAHLLDALDTDSDTPRVRAASRLDPAPGLRSAASSSTA